MKTYSVAAMEGSRTSVSASEGLFPLAGTIVPSCPETRFPLFRTHGVIIAGIYNTNITALHVLILLKKDFPLNPQLMMFLMNPY